MRRCIDIMMTSTAYVNPYVVPSSESVMSMTESVSGELSEISTSISDGDSRFVLFCKHCSLVDLMSAYIRFVNILKHLTIMKLLALGLTLFWLLKKLYAANFFSFCILKIYVVAIKIH